ncbi:hypothetical protein DERF_000776 [Dermatophagoides farinae]|uniref:Ig-like domain-containing protein n=1 Tax=Dermatophagoides farinae TaxID=6954 RepID=A0A922I9G1_DERFA|nr:uncharacterized protein LOC124496154 [Dermatophagoides farinae]KAH9526712.1 hypothetical protein DERF_000776 [Dermatophagoides farinae]
MIDHDRQYLMMTSECVSFHHWIMLSWCYNNKNDENDEHMDHDHRRRLSNILIHMIDHQLMAAMMIGLTTTTSTTKTKMAIDNDIDQSNIIPMDHYEKQKQKFCWATTFRNDSFIDQQRYQRYSPPLSSSSSSLFKIIIIIMAILSLSTISVIDCIKVVSLNVPPHVRKGSDLQLSCLFDLDNATLYSLKWFYRAHEWDRDEQEFFRFTPRHKPYKQVFPLDGIQVDLSKSSGSIVYIRRASSKTSGKYKCEISVEETFQTVAAEKLMTVFNSNHSPFINHLIVNSFILLNILIISIWIIH